MARGLQNGAGVDASNAQALIQAKYDQAPAVGVYIVVDQQGLARG